MNYGQNTYAAPTYLDTSIRQNYFDPVTKFWQEYDTFARLPNPQYSV
jgi:hypothetical protein